MVRIRFVVFLIGSAREKNLVTKIMNLFKNIYLSIINGQQLQKH